ncbi:carbamoyltransferase [Candidatus Altiarchaeota archaeon]
MSVILGIHDSAFDSGASLVIDGRLTHAIQEERVSRIKHCGGFPSGSIKAILESASLKPSDVDHVACGNTESELPLQVYQAYTNNSSFLDPLRSSVDRFKIRLFESYVNLMESSNAFDRMNRTLSDSFLRHLLGKQGINAGIMRFDHHLNHAASTFYTSGFDRCLMVTADARGDMLSSTVSLGEDGKGIEMLGKSHRRSSLGHLYGGVTEYLGFGYGDGEGKTEALAAFGQHTSLVDKLSSQYKVEGTKIIDGVGAQRLASLKLAKVLSGYGREDIAYAVQKTIEDIFSRVVMNAIDETGIKNVALAGGLFLNVKLNQAILAIDDVKDIFIHPAAGDNGIPSGAAFNLYTLEETLKPTRLMHAYLGNEYTNEECERWARESGLRYEYIEDIAGHVGQELLPKDKIIGWFQGRMEYGPRALGARSVLINPKNPGSPKKVRSTIKNRPEFQPFCPSIIAEAESEYIENPKGIYTPFMIITLTAREKMMQEAPAVVFRDYSVRVQSLDKQYNPEYHRLIRAFGNETGTPIVLNTSFNRSGEPIVYDPGHAIYDLKTCNLDYLAVGNYLIENVKR